MDEFSERVSPLGRNLIGVLSMDRLGVLKGDENKGNNSAVGFDLLLL